MTDDLEILKAALRAARPAPDAERRTATLSAAMRAYDANGETLSQGSAPQLRPMSDRPERAGLLTGVRKMLSSLTSRGVLAATASAAALGLGLVIIAPVLKLPHGPVAPPAARTTTTAPLAPTSGAAARQKLAAGDADAAKPAQPVTAQNSSPSAAPPRLEAAPAADQIATAHTSPTPSNATTEMSDQSGGAKTGKGIAASGPPAPASSKGSATLRDLFAESTTSADLPEQPAHPDSVAGMARGTGFDAAPNEPAPVFASSPTAPASMSAGSTHDTEAYPKAEANPVHIAAEEPVSTFSIDVDTASYAVIRSSLLNGELPPAGAVRIEEMVNYFPYDYPAPLADEAPFKASVSVVQTPWNPDTRLLRIGIQGRLPATTDRPPLNLVFLIDTSGSMEDADKLPLLKQSFRLMLGQLHPEDRVAIVTYAGSAGEVLPPTSAAESARILAALENLSAGGSTAGQEGLQQAYAVADRMKKVGTVTRVLLATDGDFNVGLSDPAALKDFIATERKSGTYLSVLGFGRGNLDDATMQALAQNGNGTAAYIDTLSEAQKVLGDQLTGALFPIADDVKIQMEFNPAVVADYRLIGYETRALNREDFNNDKVDAGEIGAGTAVTALYEVTPVGSPATHADPLRYQTAPAATADASASGELGYLKLRYKEPGAGASKLIALPVSPEPGKADDDTRFAAAIAGFGQLLTGATYLGDWGWDDAIALANGARGADPYGYRVEAVQLMRLAMSLSH